MYQYKKLSNSQQKLTIKYKRNYGPTPYLAGQLSKAHITESQLESTVHGRDLKKNLPENICKISFLFNCWYNPASSITAQWKQLI